MSVLPDDPLRGSGQHYQPRTDLPPARGTVVPIAVLVCEGGPQSPDVRTLSKILAGLCEVRPFGSKYGMGDRIKGMRQNLGPVVFGILDGDFQELDQPVAERPRDWIVEEQVFGWRWGRKEIENYL